ncbi:hypothetical protein E4U42_004348 [Claviceps africana]|uniref:Protein required for cell viability n=1 Tax=Claviceps africana TaxID=83212 RepID=A0A8K0JCM8_9HYPO|nr:hypothetical protein E4U42_004348 [Claviceps africana]
MADSAHPKGSPTKIVEEIATAGKAAFDPSATPQVREPALQAYQDLIASTSTWTLLPALNSLIKPNILPPWLRDPLLQALTRLPLRPDGVRGTMEFVFSVHPSNQDAAAHSQQPQKSGANITHEAVAVATRLLSTVPAAMSPEEWYGGIAPQLFALFDGEAGEDLAKTAAQIVGFGILGKKQMGAPGWNAFVRPLLEPINHSLQSTRSRDLGLDREICKSTDEIVSLARDKILVSDVQLAAAVRRLRVLILSNPSPGLSRRVLKPVILQLWALASMPNPPETIARKYCMPAETLLHTYFTLFGKKENIAPLIQDILCEGASHGSEYTWRFRADGHSNIDVEAVVNSEMEVGLLQLEPKAEKLVKLIVGSCSNEEISALFLGLLNNWIQSMKQQQEDRTTIKTTIVDGKQDDSPIQQLGELTILQKLMDTAPDKLVSHFDQLMEIICQMLRGNEQIALGDDVMAVVLSLLNVVITSASFKRSDVQPRDMNIIEVSLQQIGRAGNSDVSATARNLAMLLQYRDQVDQPPDGRQSSASAPSSRQREDRKTYSLAMNYITGDRDNPPPVVSEGLAMLSTLITAESPILDITAVTVLMSNLLRENEDYINLRVIKIFTQLANKHPKSTVRELVENYLDTQEHSSTDIRLRFGEALIQVIERLGETFSGDVAIQTGETILSIAGRRGRRPKTQARQAREERLAKLKKDKAAREGRDGDDSDGGHDPDENEDEDMTEADRKNNEMLEQIIQGWESKRGSEDVRMRTSALSIFGAALEVNVAGLGPTLVSNAVDLCINVLTVERDMEYGILRRAAILVILGFVRALHHARQSGRSLGFGLTLSSRQDIERTLEYVAETDNDGLVQQHARDVVESLQNWHVGSLLSQVQEQRQGETMGGGFGLRHLAGLKVNPAESTGLDTYGRTRRRIEEIE